MKIWLVSTGVDYEGSEVREILDHVPTQEDIDRAVDPETGKNSYIDYVSVQEWEVPGGKSTNLFWIQAPENKYPEELGGNWDGRFLLENTFKHSWKEESEE